MKTLAWREFAKFGCGVETFHSIAHWYLLAANVNLTILGITQTPTWNVVNAVLHGGVAILLGWFAWRRKP